MRRTVRDTDERSAYPVTRSYELVSFDGSYYEALNPAHSHTHCKQLKRKSFPCAACSDKVQISVFIFLAVEQIENAKRVIKPVYAQHNLASSDIS